MFCGIEGFIGACDDVLDRITTPQRTHANADGERYGLMRVLLIDGIEYAGHVFADCPGFLE
jgi:hypothetical protein